MTRRGLLLLAAAPAAAADAEFPAALEPGAGMPRLVLNGTGARLWSPLRIEVYRAALYLEAPSCDAAAILASSRPRLIEARYRRAVPLEGVVAAWEEVLSAHRCPGPSGTGCAPSPRATWGASCQTTSGTGPSAFSVQPRCAGGG
jgi:hypothetical protein